LNVGENVWADNSVWIGGGIVGSFDTLSIHLVKGIRHTRTGSFASHLGRRGPPPPYGAAM